MKKLFLILPLLTPLAVLSCGNTTVIKDEKNVDVVILSGQSNAEGYTSAIELQKKISSDTFDYYKNGIEGSNIRYNSNKGTNKSRYFEQVMLGQGVTQNHFGPELGMALYFKGAKLKRDVYIIKATMGGTGIYIDSGVNSWASPSSGATGTLYTHLISWVNSSLKIIEEEGKIPHIKALCWMQGEHDACDATWAKAYKDNEYALFTDIFKEFKDYCDEDYGSVDGLIQTDWTYHEEINEAKIENAARMNNAYIIDPITAGLRTDTEPIESPDLPHYDSLDMIELGKMFGSKLIENLLTK